MNNIKSTLLIFLFCIGIAEAQEYVKFKTDSFSVTINDDEVISFHKGEIVPFKNLKEESIEIKIKEDVFKEVKFPSDDFEIASDLIEYYNSQEQLITIKKDGFLFIDVNSFEDSITFKIINNNGDIITELKNIRSAFVDKTLAGETFKLIISNGPTLYYNVNGIKEYSDPNLDSDGDGVIDSKDNCPDEIGTAENGGCPTWIDKLIWWHCSLFAVGVLFILALLWLLLFWKKVPKQHEFKGDSLSRFAEEHGISLNKLLKLNKDSINKGYKDLLDKNKKNTKRELRGKLLTVGYKLIAKTKKEKLGQTAEPYLPKGPSKVEEGVPKISFSNGLSKQIDEVYRSLLNEIRQSKGNNNNSELNKLTRKIGELETDNQKLEMNLGNADKNNNALSENNKSLVNKLEEAGFQITELNELQSNFTDVSFLVSYAKNVLEWFNFCRIIEKDIFECYQNSNHSNQEQTSSVAWLIVNYKNNIKNIPFGNWMNIIQEFIGTGLTSNKQLRESFEQLESKEEKVNEFKRLLFTNVLEDYSNYTMVILESLSNLDRFNVSCSNQNKLKEYVLELKNKSMGIGVDIKYVQLFNHYENYLGIVESINGSVNAPFNLVKGLDSGDIHEIKSFGITTLFSDTKTQVILS